MSMLFLLLGTALALLVTNILVRVFTSSLRSIPGPFLAKISDLWRFFQIYGGKAEVTQRRLHQKYGPAVRLGPNCVSLSDPNLIKTIYPPSGKWIKSDFYAVNDIATGKGQAMATIFGSRDEDWHTEMVRPIKRLYTMPSVRQVEPLFDRTIQVFLEKLNDHFVSKKKPCPIDRWLHFLAWDGIGRVTFSSDLGFLTRGEDVDKLIVTGEKTVDYFSLIGQIPVLDKLFDKNPVYRIGPPSFGSAAAYAAERLNMRTSGTDPRDAGISKDFLDSFLEIKNSEHEIDENQIIIYLIINVIAGSDTVAIELRAAVYFLCKRAQCAAMLQAELDNAQLDLSRSPLQWEDVSKLPYLDAVICETLRLHPAVGLALERVVPRSGLTLPDGRAIPPGTIVGINPAVIHHDEAIFGAEVGEFRPERWLAQDGESAEAFKTRVARMRETNIAYGHGKRICTGRFLATLEMYKVIATLFAAYNVSLVEPQKEWKVRNSWFMRQWDMDVWLEPRKQ